MIAIVSGHPGLADWLFLIAALVFVLAGLVLSDGRRDPRAAGELTTAGLALVAIGLLVL